MSVRSAGIARVPAIDGLRGLAVAAVVVYHFFGRPFSGGYLGVDIFFVLSGFLITALLVRESADTNRLSLPGFWRRRARRILPAALTVLVVISAVVPLVGGDAGVGLGSQVLGVLFFVNNWVQIADAQSYFSESGVQLFAHYWSLSVEEQFYLVWPFVALIVVAKCARRWALTITLGLAVASAAAMALLYTPGVDPTRVYYGTDTHAFGLLIGAAVALWMTSDNPSPLMPTWPRRRSIRGHHRGLAWLSSVALLGVGIALFTLGDQSSAAYRGGIVGVSAATAIVLIAVVHGVGPVARLFAWQPMRWIGQRSYSLYLWHWPVVVLLRQWSDDRNLVWSDNRLVVGLIALAMSLGLTEATFRWIETPFRRKGFRGTLAQLHGVRGAAMSAGVAALVVAMLAAVVTAPSVSSTERDLAALAGNLQRENTTRTYSSVQKPRERVMPTGDQITILGDSVTLASSASLRRAFPGVYIDAAVSRSWEPVPGMVAELKARRALAPYVVLGFGTNGTPRDGLLRQVLSAIGPRHKIILVTTFADRWWTADANRQAFAAARTFRNVTVADWSKAIGAHRNWLREDGVHPIAGVGTDLFASTVKAGLWRAATS